MKLNTLNIELTSHCNLSCKWCILDNSRPKGYMTEELLGHVFDEIRNYDIREIALYSGGESLLHSDLKKLLEIIASKKTTQVFLVTNATLLNKKISRIIIRSNAIDKLSFSIDGGNKKDYEEIKKGGKWGEVISNANNFLDMNKNIKTEIYCLVKDFNKQNLSDEFRNLMKRVDYVKIEEPNNWDGSQDLGLDHIPKKGLCDFILTNLVVLWDGRVVPCCADLNGRGIIGDLNHSSLYDVYKGKARLNMVKKMRKNKRRDIELCRDCSL